MIISINMIKTANRWSRWQPNRGSQAHSADHRWSYFTGADIPNMGPWHLIMYTSSLLEPILQLPNKPAWHIVRLRTDHLPPYRKTNGGYTTHKKIPCSIHQMELFIESRTLQSQRACSYHHLCQCWFWWCLCSVYHYCSESFLSQKHQWFCCILISNNHTGLYSILSIYLNPQLSSINFLSECT